MKSSKQAKLICDARRQETIHTSCTWQWEAGRRGLAGSKREHFRAGDVLILGLHCVLCENSLSYIFVIYVFF